MGVPLIAANLASVAISSLLYGLFCVLFCGSTYLMVVRRRSFGGGRRRTERATSFFDPQFLIAICIYITVTLHWIILVYRSFQGFIYDMDPGGTASFYADLAQPSYIAATALRFATQRCADLLRLYRLCVVWSHLRVVAAAVSLLFLATIGCDISIIYFLTQWHVGQDVIGSTLGHLMISETVTMTCMNLTCCAFIIGRLWRTAAEANSIRVQRNGIPGRKDNALLWLMSIFAENASLYMMFIIAFLVAFIVSSDLQYPLADFLAPVSGIAFMLINIRVGIMYLPPQTTEASALEFRSRLSGHSEDTRVESKMSFALAPVDLGMTEEGGEEDVSKDPGRQGQFDRSARSPVW